MKQETYSAKQQSMPKERYPDLYSGRKSSFGGFDFNFMGTGTFEHSADERKKTYEELWSYGDFHFWLATYYDMLFSDDANTEAYNFW